MTILQERRFSGDLIITDPLYLMADNQNKPGYPKLDDFIPVTISNSMLETNQAVRDFYNAALAKYHDAEEEWKRTHEQDWDICQFGDRMDLLGFKEYIVSPTEYGCWSCETRVQHSGLPLGRFASDSGLVGVFLLSEIQKYNIKYTDHFMNKWAATVIPQFNGVVKIINATDKHGVDAKITVIGTGNINFYTAQIGY